MAPLGNCRIPPLPAAFRLLPRVPGRPCASALWLAVRRRGLHASGVQRHTGAKMKHKGTWVGYHIAAGESRGQIVGEVRAGGCTRAVLCISRRHKPIHMGGHWDQAHHHVTLGGRGCPAVGRCRPLRHRLPAACSRGPVGAGCPCALLQERPSGQLSASCSAAARRRWWSQRQSPPAWCARCAAWPTCAAGRGPAGGQRSKQGGAVGSGGGWRGWAQVGSRQQQCSFAGGAAHLAVGRLRLGVLLAGRAVAGGQGLQGAGGADMQAEER